MRVLVVHAHPIEDSFNAGLFRLVTQKLAGNGHEVDAIDLYAEGFDPCLSREGRARYQNPECNRAGVEDHVARLLAADALVLVYPVWNYGYPAILKGWFDRVFLPGVSFDLVDGKVRPALRNIRSITVVTSYGGSRFRAWLMGDPPRKLANRVLRATVRPGAKVRYLAHYDMNLSTIRTRRGFMEKVEAALDRI